MKPFTRIAIVFVFLIILGWFLIPGFIDQHDNKVLQKSPYHASVRAEALHKTLRIVDLHADSLLWKRNLLVRNNRGQVDLPRLEDGNVSIQAFTIVSTSPRHLNIYRNSDRSDLIRYLAIAEGWPPRTWNSPKQRALYEAHKLQRFTDNSQGKLVLIKSRADLEHYLAQRRPGQVAAFLGVEGAQPLEGKLLNINDLYGAGIRMMAPTHFTDTAVGGSASGMSKGSLTTLGREWVKSMESMNMLIDLAHASPATLLDVTRIANRLVIVSHTGVKGTCNNPRNLSDEELRAVARTGGVVGIGLWQTATCGDDASAAARAIRYAVNIIGVDHVGIGSDFDGDVTTPFDASGWVLLTDALLKEGFSDQDIRKIMGENAIRVLEEILPCGSPCTQTIQISNR